MRGRKKLPREVRKMRGEKVGDSPEDNSIKLHDDSLQVPGCLDKMTNRQREIYEAKKRQCEALGYMETQFSDSLMVYAFCLDMVIQCQHKITEEGPVINLFSSETKCERPTVNPYVSVMDRMMRTVNAIGSQFGFTPVTKTNVHIQEQSINPIAHLERMMNTEE